jgi:hypothetical protein
MKEIAKLDGEWFDTLYAHDCTYHCVSCVEAGVCLADKWLSCRTKVIDFCGCKHLSRELINSFLCRMQEKNSLASVSDIKWYFDTNTLDFRRQFNSWIFDFMKTVKTTSEEMASIIVDALGSLLKSEDVQQAYEIVEKEIRERFK